MKISVLGAGAIGSMFGGLIQHHAPHWQVVLIGRGPHGEQMRGRGGVRLLGPWGTIDARCAVSFDPRDAAGSDCILLTVKSQSTSDALEAAGDALDGAVVVSIQNGINEPVLARYVPPERLVLGMTATNMAIVEPGAVSLQLDGTTMLGSPRGEPSGAAVEAACAVLSKSGLRIDPHQHIEAVLYNKIAMNSLGYASCLSASNLVTQALACRPWRRYVGSPIVEECLAVLAGSGIRPAAIPGRPDVARIRRFLRLLDMPLAGRAVELGARRMFNRKPVVFSLYQDLARGKKTEVEYVNGQIVALARRQGGEAPSNALVVEMVRELEARGDGTFFSRDQVIERFRRAAAPARAD